MIRRNSASFRDKSGYVYEDDDKIIRTINKCYSNDWEYVNKSGLMKKAVENGLILPCSKIDCPASIANDSIYETVCVQRLPFISHPAEWSFNQLKDAALLTLKLHRLAIEHNCVLKDASAFNIQFAGAKPVFIDILSFERSDFSKPWEGYGQFCRHFLAPLALESYIDRRCGLLWGQWIDGIPLDFACSLLPLKARLSLGMNLHLFFHASMQKQFGDARKSAEKIKSINFSKQKMIDLLDSLEKTVCRLKPADKKTEWQDYYEDTNYSSSAQKDKSSLIKSIVEKHLSGICSGNALAIDFGANDGYFTKNIEQFFQAAIAADIDPIAVDQNYLVSRQCSNTNITPVILDLTSPTPGAGWANTERKSFINRAKADFIMALALCHHLHFSGGIPFKEIAEFFFNILKPGGGALIEFAPSDDSQVKRLLAAREIDLELYNLDNFRQAFTNAGFKEISSHRIADSGRTLLYFVRLPSCN